ncbi:hypothetical protein BGZ46_008962 [Entomortierella lignicola]|nr:hypothetical protein BGZ46_008962 [Entomortierella lignicola]
MNSSSGSLNSNNTKPQRVLGFLRKRSSPTTGLTEQDRAKTILVPSTSSSPDLESPPNSMIPPPLNNDPIPGAGHPIKNMIRRKSLELGRLLDGSAGAISRSSSNSNSRSSLDQEIFLEKRPTMGMHERGISNLEMRRSMSAQQPATETCPPPSTLQGRRATFGLGLPWRPQSEYSNNDSSSGVRIGLTKAQRRFIRFFPELADLVMVPSAYCAPCMSTTPPPTPPASNTTSNASSMSPSNTLNAFPSPEYSKNTSTTSISILSCPGHFDDFSCALEREILWQGTVFVTATHICFYGKQFGKAVKVIVDYRDLVSIEKEKKMGVFPSSIRIRTRQTGTTGSPIGSREQEDQAVSSEEETKDYVLTSLISRDQAYAIMERNWILHRQVMQNLSNDMGMETPQAEMTDLEGLATDMFSMDFGTRVRSGGLREKRRDAHRTYSVVTDEVLSSTDNVTLPSKKPESRLCTPTPTNLAGSWNLRTDDNNQKKDRESSSSSSESRRGSVASSSSSEKQENGLIGFIQKRRSGQLKLRKKSDGCGQSSSQADGSLEKEEIIIQNTEIIYPSPPLGSPISTNSMEPSLSSSSIRSNIDVFRSCTPPILISPSLATTKVSHSSSTVQSLARDGSQEMSVHTRNVSSEAPKGKITDPSNSAMESVAPADAEITGLSPASTEKPILVPDQALKLASAPVPAPVLPSGPVSCGCTRHYKHAVTSVVIPLPLELCFEILFSAKGAGEGSRLTFDTHRIKDGSPDIKITPWEGELGNSCWENLQRNLEYSVTFKMPMLAKSSTACYETQQITQYRNFLILVHSESKTPNVPYGEHFSTVNQICMTWEAPGKTRIKCHTEVKFKKSIMWSSKVESGSLEGSGGFYKEFIRQLQELSESQGKQLIAQFVASSGVRQLQNGVTSTTDASSSLALPGEPSLATPEASRAQSLLLQQSQRNSATAPLSLDMAHPAVELNSSTTLTSATITPTTQAERKSTLSMLLNSFAPPGFPGLAAAAGAFADETQSSSGLNRDGTATPITSAGPLTPTLWGDYVRRGLTLIVGGRSGQQDVQQQEGNRSPSKSSDSISSASSHSSSRNSDSQNDGNNRVKFALPAGKKSFMRSSDGRSSGSSAVRSSASVPSLREQRHQHQQQQYYEQKQHHSLPTQGVQQQLQGRRDNGFIFLSRAFFVFVVLGMVVTAVNIWHLYTVVSSIVEVVHQRQDMFIYSAQQRHHHHQRQYQPSNRYESFEYDQYGQHDPYLTYASYLSNRRYDRSHYHRDQHYHNSRLSQKWTPENFDALNRESTRSQSSQPHPHPAFEHWEETSESENQQPSSTSDMEQKLAVLRKFEEMLVSEDQSMRQSLKDYKEMIITEIEELVSKLELAQKDSEPLSSIL